MKSNQKPITTQTRHLFSEEYRRMICEHYLNGDSSKEEIRAQFNIKGKSSLLYWLRKFGYIESNYKPNQELPFMAKSKKETSKSLEKENEDLKLQLEMYKRMISIAEKEFKISIVKKSDTK
jgi:transposase-like protein